MKKSEIFDRLLSKIAEICEVSADCIIQGSKQQAVVDARILMVQYLRRIGFSSDDIALIVLRRKAGDPSLCPPLDVLKKKAKGVDKTFNSYSLRCLESYVFGMMSVDIRNFCREQYSQMYLSGMKELPH